MSDLATFSLKLKREIKIEKKFQIEASSEEEAVEEAKRIAQSDDAEFARDCPSLETSYCDVFVKQLKK